MGSLLGMYVLGAVTRDEPTSPECGRMSLTTLKGGGERGGVALTATRLRSLRGLHASANTASRCRTNMEYSIRAANVDDCKDIARMIMVSGRIRGHTERRVERPSFGVRCDLRLSASHV